MKLPKLAIENYQFVLILVALSAITGVLSYTSMPRSEDPVLKVPNFSVAVVYPGANPQDIEELAVDPIEDAVNEIEDIKLIKTVIQDGLAVMRIEAEFGVNVNDKEDEIKAAVNSIRNDLPKEIYSINVKKFSPFDVLIAQWAVTSKTAPYRQMQEVAENLEDEVKKVKGVRKVKVQAYPKQQVRVALDFPKMAQMNIPLSQVIGVLQGNNLNIPGGEVESKSKSFSIKTSGSFKNLETIKNTVINAYQDRVVYLKDIAEVYFDYEDDRHIGRFNGQKAVFLAITQKEGQNILDIQKNLNKTFAEFSATLPKNIEVKQAFVQAPAVESRINDFFINLFQGILLVGAIIFIFLGGRPSLIVMTVIPTAIIIAITTLDFSGFGLQQISIAGLVIALGLLVDNGIVVIENISRFMKEGHPLREAAYKATSEVGWAIVSSTVTTILAFFPMTQLPGATGEFLKTLPLIVIYSLLASLLLALTFTPLLAGKFLKNPKKGKNQKPKLIDRALNWLINKLYLPVLNFSIKRPLVILLIAISTFAGSMALFPLVGVSFFPNADKPLLLVDVNLPKGTSLARTDSAARFVEREVAKMPLVKDYATNVGKGNPQVYYNRVPRNFDKTHAQLMLNLKEWDPKKFYAMIEDLRGKFAAYPGAKITVQELKNGPPFDAPIAIKVLGKNLDTLKRLSKEVEKMITASEGVINLDNPLAIDKTELQVDINRDKAGMMNLPLSDIDLAVRTSLSGFTVAEVNFSSGKKYDMVLRLPYDEKYSIDDFDKIYVANRMGGQVPLSQLAKLRFEGSPARIGHYNLAREATVMAGVKEGYNVASITQDIIKRLDKFKLPKGYKYVVEGEFKTQQDSFGNLGQILVVALLGIFAVLVLQFRSFKQPFVVFSAIPLAFTGSIVALFLTGYSFSFFAFVGFTSLVGIVINNSIILVDYTNQLLASGSTLKDAIFKASSTRFTPIVLTTMTTILGLLPLTLTNSGLWSPLGWTIIGGMISSTFLTLLIVPILLKWFTKEPKVAMETA